MSADCPDLGSMGTAFLPMVELEGALLDAAAVVAERINILIVDDEAANLVVLETVLDDPSYRLVRAQTADQALMALVREDFALLILDIRMPDMTGFELAQMIKERKKTAGVPIIFLTAYYDTDRHVLEGYGTGAVDFLTKPVNSVVLRSKVAVFADLHRKSQAVAFANLALLQEVEERRRAEEQLRLLNMTLEQRVVERTDALGRADQQLREMMGSISDGLLMLDREWRFTYANEQGARLLGVAPQALLGTCIWDIASHSIGKQAEAAYRQAMQTRERVSFEEYFESPSGHWLQCHCYPSDAGLSVYFLDVTHRREAESRREALLGAERAARAQGERVARAKEEFLASLSHELRTPLAAILGWTTVLQREAGLGDKVVRGVDIIARNTRALSKLVADLLDVSRVVSGKLRVEMERIDLNQIAQGAADESRPNVQAKGLTIETRLPSSPVEICGDTARLHQIVSNLLTNAIKFTPAGGVVTVSVSATDSVATMEVADTGQGIAADFLPQLFDRFSQADSSAARVHGGLGLGLSIVKSLVEVHGGRVTAQSAGLGRGASFAVQFPLLPPGESAVLREPEQAPSVWGELAAPPATADGLPGEYDLTGVSVLLVDDHEDVLGVERRFLSDSGAQVTTANSAENAIELLKNQRFDVLLSDLGMPGMDGFSLIRAVRCELGLDPDALPAAAVTAFIRAEDRRLALAEGYQAVIQKPVSPLELSRVVTELMRSSQP